MKFKDMHFRGKIEKWIWKQKVEHAIQSLGYEVNEGLCSESIHYINQEGVPVYLASSGYTPDIFAKIGDRKDLEKIDQEGNLEKAVDDLIKLNGLEGFNTDQIHFRKKQNGKEIHTGGYMLYRNLSRNSTLAISEFNDLHQIYKEFRKKYGLAKQD